MPTKILLFPSGGLNTKAGYQTQPPYTTRSCLNVMPEETIAGRDRGGSRPGLEKDYIYGSAVAGTLVGQPVKDNGTSTVTASAAVFNSSMVGGTITFDGTSVGYTIASFTSTTIIVVTGDASGEGSGDTFVVTGGIVPVAMGTPGTGSAVNLLSSVRKIGASGPGTFIQDSFDAGSATPDANYWDNAVDTSAWDSNWNANLAVDTTNKYLYNSDTDPDTGGGKGLVLIASGGGGEFVGTSDINWETPVTLHASIPSNDATYGSLAQRNFSFFFFMDASSPDGYADSLEVNIRSVQWAANTSAATVVVTWNLYSSSSKTVLKTLGLHLDLDQDYDVRISLYPGLKNASGHTAFEVLVELNNIRFGVANTYAESTYYDVSANHRIGVGMYENSQTSGAYPTPAFSSLSLLYSSLSSITLPQEVLVAASGGTLYREQVTLGTVAQVTTDNANGIELTDTVSARQRLGLLYIADYDLVTDQTANSTDTIGITDATGVLTHTAAPAWDFSALGVTTVDRIEITDASNNSAIGTWKLSAVGTTTVTIANWLTLGGDVTTVLYRILCGPKVYSPSTDTLATWHNTTRTASDTNAIPIACKIVSSFKDRMVLTADGTGAVYMSRAGDPNDWDFSASNTDDSRAIGLGATNSDVAGLPEAVTAVIPHTDDYLLISSKNTFWVLRGDPGRGGVLDNLSLDIGCISRFAWCKDTEGGVFFLTTNGIYYQPYGATIGPQKLSKKFIPQNLLGIDLEVYEPFLVYSLQRDGVFIYISAKNKRSMDAWFFDSETAGFFPMRYVDQNHHPTSVLSYKPETQGFTKTLLGGKDGFIRTVDGTTDDGDTFVSRVSIGPINLGNVGGFIKTLRATLAESSGDVGWSLSVDDSAEGALQVAPLASGTWVAGHNYLDRPNLVGRAAYVTLSASTQWAMEQIEAFIEAAPEHMPL